MFKGITIFLLILTTILFPIPLKITLKYSNKVLEMFIYNKKIKLKVPSKTGLKTDSKKSFVKSLTFSDIRSIFYKIVNLKFKSTLILSTKLEYGFDDSAFVAILFGLIHSTYSFLYLSLLKFFKVKTIDFQVIPHFKKNDFNIEIFSIIYINLAKIIYVAFLYGIHNVNLSYRHKT